MAANFQGKDVKMAFYQNGSPVVIKCKSLKVSPNVNKVADGVCGEDRDQLDQVTNFYDVTADIYQSDALALRAAITDQRNQDAQVEQLSKTFGFRILARDGSRAAFVLKEVTWDEWNWDVSDRSSTVMMTLTFRARYFEEVKAP